MVLGENTVLHSVMERETVVGLVSIDLALRQRRTWPADCTSVSR